MTPADVPFSCTCGRVHGVIHDVAPDRGNHLKCYCKSCQTAARVLGYEDSLDDMGGTSVFQTVPSKVSFESGVDQLACLRLSHKGLLRWYASCCDAPLFTMPDASWFAIAGLNMKRINPVDLTAFGIVVGIHQAKSAQSPPDGFKDFGLKRAAIKLVWRAFKALIRRDSGAPFFDASGKLTVKPRVLTLQERRAAEPEKKIRATY